MDYRLYHAINDFFAAHRWLAHAFSGFESVAPAVLGVAAFGLWLLARPGAGNRWKLASASAAFGIAFAVFFFDRVVGALFLAAATLIAVGRVFVGAHYPADVLAGAVVGLACAVVVVRLARPFLALCVRLVERVTDPLVAPAWRLFGRR